MEGYTRISTNFDVNIARPLDARFSVATLADRNGMQFAYAGLVLFVEEDQTLYYLSQLPATDPANWQVVGSGGGSTSIAFDGSRPVKAVPAIGQVVGGTNIIEFIEKAFYPFLDARLGTGNVALQEEGTTIDLALQVNVTANDETVFSNGRIEDTAGNQLATFPASAGAQTASLITGIDSSRTFVAKLDVGGNGTPETLSANRPVTFVAPTYFGVGAEGLTEPDIKALTKVLRTRANHNNVAFSPVNQRFYYAYPDEFGPVRQIKDPNDFDVTASFQSRVENFALADGSLKAYRILYNNSDTSQTDFHLDFIF